MIVDTLASIVFFTTVATLSELLIAGMEPGQVFVTRAIMMPVMIVTGRPYGLWRDGLFRYCRPQMRIAKAVVDIASFLSFQVPVYVLTLVIAGAALPEILAAVGSAIVFMVTLSRPFGLYLEIVRKRFGGSPI